ncbi:hypothetical protein LTR78_010459 [Recurvomyces mirabilis]|uniref:Uncharacterized protein n=1 Tax=Recurvomyces mirabilis TaxID=574656 RepID=A0AAE0TQ01_9PEZI|nr:hypothetical protein LTR78_010459 [Recurvomyces mirabilis]KAK5150352.1 hypothetical protein LTS14_010191 [Recurvomyces mirabilis]
MSDDTSALDLVAVIEYADNVYHRCEAVGAHDKDEVLLELSQGLLNHELGLQAAYSAVLTRAAGTRHGPQPDWLQSLHKLSELINPNSPFAELRGIVGIAWAWREPALEYTFQRLGSRSVKRLATLATLLPSWHSAVQRINAAMISRHLAAQSGQRFLDAKAIYIGLHFPGEKIRDWRKPISKVDIEFALQNAAMDPPVLLVGSHCFRDDLESDVGEDAMACMRSFVESFALVYSPHGLLIPDKDPRKRPPPKNQPATPRKKTPAASTPHTDTLVIQASCAGSVRAVTPEGPTNAQQPSTPWTSCGGDAADGQQSSYEETSSPCERATSTARAGYSGKQLPGYPPTRAAGLRLPTSLHIPRSPDLFVSSGESDSGLSDQTSPDIDVRSAAEDVRDEVFSHEQSPNAPALIYHGQTESHDSRDGRSIVANALSMSTVVEDEDIHDDADVPDDICEALMANDGPDRVDPGMSSPLTSQDMMGQNTDCMANSESGLLEPIPNSNDDEPLPPHVYCEDERPYNRESRDGVQRSVERRTESETNLSTVRAPPAGTAAAFSLSHEDTEETTLPRIEHNDPSCEAIDSVSSEAFNEALQQLAEGVSSPPVTIEHDYFSFPAIGDSCSDIFENNTRTPWEGFPPPSFDALISDNISASFTTTMPVLASTHPRTISDLLAAARRIDEFMTKTSVHKTGREPFVDYAAVREWIAHPQHVSGSPVKVFDGSAPLVALPEEPVHFTHLGASSLDKGVPTPAWEVLVLRDYNVILAAAGNSYNWIRSAEGRQICVVMSSSSDNAAYPVILETGASLLLPHNFTYFVAQTTPGCTIKVATYPKP